MLGQMAPQSGQRPSYTPAGTQQQHNPGFTQPPHQSGPQGNPQQQPQGFAHPPQQQHGQGPRQHGYEQQPYAPQQPPQQHYGQQQPQQHYGQQQPQQQQYIPAAPAIPPAAQMPRASKAYEEPPTEQVAPLPRHIPPSGLPTEPWSETLKTMMLVFGVLLVACFIAPWEIGGGPTQFAWTKLTAKGISASARVVPLLLVGTGLIAVVLGSLSLGSLVRGFSAAGIGLAPLLFLVASNKPFEWQFAVLLLCTVLITLGLLLRTHSVTSMLARVLVSAGIAGVLTTYLVPDHGSMPIKELIDGLVDAPLRGRLALIVGGGSILPVGVLPLVLCLLAALVWLPGPNQLFLKILLWSIIALGLVANTVQLLLAEEILSTLKSSLHVVFYGPLARLGWLALATYGLGIVMSQQTEGR
jgi:hypothetical protein